MIDKRDVQAFFDRLAPDWDAGMVRNEAVIARILDNAGVCEGCTVLDVACGTGVLFGDYVKRGAARVTAVDLSPEMAARAAEKAAGTQAAVQLSREYYPTRRYGTFSLPAGQYFSLRVTLGQGLGHNWWCVVYPPLCAQSAQESLAGAAILSEEDARLLAEDGESYIFRFRLLELWGELREKLEG